MDYGYNIPIIDPITGKKIDCNYEEDIMSWVFNKVK